MIESFNDITERLPLKPGSVALVGAGSGDPELLTIRALRLIQGCDEIVYDRLVSTEILALIPSQVNKLYVGKSSGNHSLPQDDINQLLIERAKLGKRVVRLKGGDPYLFGRGGEEVEALIAEHIPVSVVPGITAAAACAAYNNIPLTHRSCAQSVTFVTGHLKNGELELPWQALAQKNSTLVVYMGLANAKVISDQLIAHGMPADLPSAIIENGSRPDQRILRTALHLIAEEIQRQEIKSPALLIFGEVVSLLDSSSDVSTLVPSWSLAEYSRAS